MRLVRTPIRGISSRTGGEAGIAFAVGLAGLAAVGAASGVAALRGGAGGRDGAASGEQPSTNAATDTVTRARAATPPDGRHAVLVMDADSALHPGFIHNAVARLAPGKLAAIGGTFTGKPGGGLVGMFQRNEYARYARDVRRLQGKALVLTGTATLFRALALKEVVSARRAGRLPGRDQVYDVRVLTEDNELTLALLHLRFRILCPAECTLTTEVMETWADLFKQRLRWKRGALENLTDYGWTRVTLPYWGRQLLSLVGIIVIFAYLGATTWSIVVAGGLVIHPLWLAITVIFMIERVVTVSSRGPKQMAIASLLFVEMVFDVFLQIAQAKAFWDAAWRRERKW
ncbi:glycosyltransferase [Microtetraspora fusca]|uniref:Glycosyltransferase n=1 Tax=Microtetraspora fusca TaxID=1997 RepID=A0ABW6V6F2_MICFU